MHSDPAGSEPASSRHGSPEQGWTSLPHASWVMGRSARWHDPQLQAEIAAEEIAAAGSRRLAVQLALVGLSGGIDGPAALFTVPRLVRVLIRLVDRYRRARRG